VIIPDRKKAVTAILAKFSPGKYSQGGEVRNEAGGEMDECKEIAQDMVVALSNKSVEGVASALRAFKAYLQKEDEIQDEKE